MNRLLPLVFALSLGFAACDGVPANAPVRDDSSSFRRLAAPLPLRSTTTDAGTREPLPVAVAGRTQILPDERAPRTQRCDVVMSKEALCACLRRQAEELESGMCELETLIAPNFASMRTPEGNLFAVARKGVGYYELTRLHAVGMQDFAVRGARIRPSGNGHVLRIVTYRQEGSSDFIHTTNEVVLCAITMPRTPGVGCARYPLYAHTRVHDVDAPSEQESRFRVGLTEGGQVDVQTRSGPLEHPELSPALGVHMLAQGAS